MGTLFGPQGQTINGGAAGNNWFINLELAGPDSGFGGVADNFFNGGRNNYDFAQPCNPILVPIVLPPIVLPGFV